MPKPLDRTPARSTDRTDHGSTHESAYMSCLPRQDTPRRKGVPSGTKVCGRLSRLVKVRSEVKFLTLTKRDNLIQGRRLEFRRFQEPLTWLFVRLSPFVEQFFALWLVVALVPFWLSLATLFRSLQQVLKCLQPYL